MEALLAVLVVGFIIASNADLLGDLLVFLGSKLGKKKEGLRGLVEEVFRNVVVALLIILITLGCLFLFSLVPN